MTPSPPRPALPPLDLPAFCERVGNGNPFLQDRTQASSLDEVDAATVHDAAFRRLVELARTARDQHLGLGVLLMGEAGVGKSHLLGRLHRWAHKDDTPFVPLHNLQAAPDHLPRSLLRVTVSILTHGREEGLADTTLFGMVDAAVRAAVGPGSLPGARDIERAYGRLVSSLSAQVPAQAALVDRAAYGVLLRFWQSARQAQEGHDDGRAARAVRWLAGDPLEPEEGRDLGLPPLPAGDQAAAVGDNQQIKLVLVALSQMALYGGRPLILCLDQVENVEPEQVSALARFAHALLDSAPNLLLVTCGVHDVLLRWNQEQVVQRSSWDRLAQFEILLPRVTPREARQIVQVRLENFLEPFVELEPVKQLTQQDDLFPLGEAWAREHLEGKVELSPRQVVRWARDGWIGQQAVLRDRGGPRWLGEWRGGPVGPVSDDGMTLEDRIDRRVEAKLREEVTRRLLDPQSLPPDADNLAGLLSSLLDQGPCRARGVEVVRPEAPSRRQRPTYDLLVRRTETPAGATGRTVTTGVVILTTAHAGTAAAWALRRVLEDRQPPDRLVLVTEERRPLRLGARGQEYLARLPDAFRDRYRAVPLSFEQYASLDALKATVGLARAGDLDVEVPGAAARPIDEAEVVASHQRQGRYTAHPLLAELLGASDGPTSLTRPGAATSAPSPTAPSPTAPSPTAPSPAAPSPTAPSLTAPEEAALRQLVLARLALMPGLSSHELTKYWLHQSSRAGAAPVDETACRRWVEEVLRRMHADKLLQATPLDDGLYILARRR